MQLSDLQTLVASLCNDPGNARYSISDINTELDNTQGQWNAEIKIIRHTTSLSTVAGTRRYALANLTQYGAPISFPRVTHKGIDLKKRSKSYFDLYTGDDWTQAKGTPTDFFIEATDELSNNLQLDLYPTPQAGDAGENLVVEAIVAHTPMSAPTDVPFLDGEISNFLLRPYDFYIAYSAAARLLARDPSITNSPRAGEYLKIAGEGKDLLINVFKQLETDESPRLRGGRMW